MTTKQDCNQDCNFCQSYGMPILPVRPGIMEKGNVLPTLPVGMAAPLEAEGEMDFTTRLLRPGFLYIWAERGRRWINYLVTERHFFYPLPQKGGLPSILIGQDIKPCVDDCAKWAKASFILLPVIPGEGTNGVYWFSWSEEQWTEEVRKKHEDPQWRSRYMQPFDMDAWLKTHHGQQALPITHLHNTVAEYNPLSAHSSLALWSPQAFTPVTSHSAQDMQDTAQALHANNGAILMLSDPVANAMEISALARHRMSLFFMTDPEIRRGAALMTMLSSVELSMRSYYTQSMKFNDDVISSNMRHGTGFSVIPRLPAPESALQQAMYSESTLEKRVDEKWQAYEQYIDRDKERAFREKLAAHLSAFNQSTIVPMTRMYLSVLKGRALIHYFMQHFDPRSPHSGGRYIQTVFNCLAGMEEKAGVIDYMEKQLNAAGMDQENYLLRALFANNDEWAEVLDAEIRTGGRDWLSNMSWDRLADAVKEFGGKYAGIIALQLEKVSYLLQTAVMKSIDSLVQGIPVRFAISIMALQGQVLKVVSVNTGVKNYVRALTGVAGNIMELNGRTGGELYSVFRKEADRLVKNMPKGATINTVLPIAIDIEGAKKLTALPKADRLGMALTVLRTEEDIRQAILSHISRGKLASFPGMAPGAALASVTQKGLPLAGSAISAYFQSWVLINGIRKGGWPGTANELARMSANGAMAVAALMDMIKRISGLVVSMELIAPVNAAAKLLLRFSSFSGWEMLGFAGGLLYTGLEAFDGVVALFQGKTDIGIAHLINALGVGMLTAAGSAAITLKFLALVGISQAALSGSALLAFILGPVGIVTGVLLVLASGAYMVSQMEDNVQEWLASMQWRRVPAGKKTPAMYPEWMEEKAYKALFPKEKKEKSDD